VPDAVFTLPAGEELICLKWLTLVDCISSAFGVVYTVWWRVGNE
jgi:hypothetical protein